MCVLESLPQQLAIEEGGRDALHSHYALQLYTSNNARVSTPVSMSKVSERIKAKFLFMHCTTENFSLLLQCTVSELSKCEQEILVHI